MIELVDTEAVGVWNHTSTDAIYSASNGGIDGFLYVSNVSNVRNELNSPHDDEATGDTPQVEVERPMLFMFKSMTPDPAISHISFYVNLVQIFIFHAPWNRGCSPGSSGACRKVRGDRA